VSGPYADANTAIRALWTSDFSTSVSGAVVRWAENANETIPAADYWLHNEVEFTSEDIVAFGGGRALNEREIFGRVCVLVMSRRGRGESSGLTLLDDALATFRSKRSGGLSFVGASAMPDPAPSADGLWWVRTGIASFTYRFQG
jgi:hypothetical protein